MMSSTLRRALLATTIVAGTFIAAAPAAAQEQNLPPTTVITAQIDPLQSEGIALAQKLKDAGVQVDHKDYAGVTHEFFGMGVVVAKARQASDAAVANAKQALSK